MQLGEALVELAVIVTGNVVVTGALAFVAKSLTSQWLTKDVERYKAKLQSDNTAAIESLRNDLRIQALEHEGRFRQLHAIQAEVIAAVYGEMFDRQRKDEGVSRLQRS